MAYLFVINPFSGTGQILRCFAQFAPHFYSESRLFQYFAPESSFHLFPRINASSRQETPFRGANDCELLSAISDDAIRPGAVNVFHVSGARTKLEHRSSLIAPVDLHYGYGLD